MGGPRRVRPRAGAAPARPAERLVRRATAHAGRRDRFLLGRMLLRDLAADAGGITPEDVTVTAVCGRCGAEHGRPRAALDGCRGAAAGGRASPRAHGLVVAALAPPGVAVGVDVEPAACAVAADEAARRADVADLLGGSPAHGGASMGARRGGAEGRRPRPAGGPGPGRFADGRASRRVGGGAHDRIAIVDRRDRGLPRQCRGRPRAALTAARRRQGRQLGSVQPRLEERADLACPVRVADEVDEVRRGGRGVAMRRGPLAEHVEEVRRRRAGAGARAASALRACRAGRRTCSSGRDRR